MRRLFRVKRRAHGEARYVCRSIRVELYKMKKKASGVTRRRSRRLHTNWKHTLWSRDQSRSSDRAGPVSRQRYRGIAAQHLYAVVLEQRFRSCVQTLVAKPTAVIEAL